MAERAPPAPTLLRKLAPIELYSSTRHHLGVYRAVVLSSRYHFASPSPNGSGNGLDEVGLYYALSKVIAKHPMLRVGIVGENTNQARFCHVPHIDLQKHITFTAISCETPQEYEDVVATRHGWHHDQLWQNVDTLPAWRIQVLTAESIGSLKGSHDIIFAFHHALFDGTSGKFFHEDLLSALNNPDDGPPNPEAAHLLSFPTPPILPEGQEDAISFNCSVPFMIRNIWDSIGPSWLKPSKKYPWAGKPIDFSHPHITRIKAIDFSPETLSALLSACKAHSTSLQALLHALVLASLTHRLLAAQAPTFKATTPISLRPFLKPTVDKSLNDTLRVLVTVYTHEFPALVVKEFRAQDADIDALIWKNASRVKEELGARLSTLPSDDLIGMTKYVSDWFDYFQKMDHQPRNASWEISNIGVIKNEPSAPVTAARITRLLFSNSSMVTGQPFGVNVASVAGGALTIGLSWQDGIVTEELMFGLAEDLTAFTDAFCKTGRFCIEYMHERLHNSVA